jgi:hypothetical protein
MVYCSSSSTLEVSKKEGVKSPLIWNFAYNIDLAVSQKKKILLKSFVFAPLAAPKIPDLFKNTSEIELQLTSWVD